MKGRIWGQKGGRNAPVLRNTERVENAKPNLKIKDFERNFAGKMDKSYEPRKG